MYNYNIFHEELMQSLIDSVNENKASNAYIFEGPKGMNKHECARLFAAALTCESNNAPCGVCKNCMLSHANTNPDIKLVKKPDDKKKTDVETIRNVNADSIIRPYTSKRKVYIIDNGDSMTVEAQNAFLKTFEEPPEYAVFIIVVQNIENLLPTIISRAEVVSFTSVSKERILQYIKEKYPRESERAVFLQNYCEGIPGRIDEIVTYTEFEEIRTQSLHTLPLLLNSKTEKAFEIEDFINKNTDKAQVIFDFWISFLRDLTVLKCGAFDNIINVDKLSEIKKISELADDGTIVLASDILFEGKRMLDRYVKPSAVALRCALKIK